MDRTLSPTGQDHLTTEKLIDLSRLPICDQDWDQMARIGDCRICQDCNRKIHDFRKASNADIAFIHAHSTEPVCGIYSKEQLTPPPGKNVKSHSWRSPFIGLLGLLSAQSLYAQKENPPIRTEQHPLPELKVLQQRNLTQSADSIPRAQPILYRGTVVDEQHEPLLGATILIKGTKQGLMSDENGNFVMDLTTQFDSMDQVSLIVAYVGYANLEIVVHQNDLNIVQIQGNRISMTQTMTTGFGIRRLPWYRRWWNSFLKIFR